MARKQTRRRKTRRGGVVYGCPPDFHAPGSDGLCEDGNQPMSTVPDGGKKKKRGGGLGQNLATWPPDNSSFGRFAGSPVNTDNTAFEAKKGGKRRRTRKSRRSLKRK